MPLRGSSLSDGGTRGISETCSPSNNTSKVKVTASSHQLQLASRVKMRTAYVGQTDLKV